MSLTEDQIYRSSTQYKLWSFTPESLSSLRKTTNETAAARVISAIKKRKEASQDEAANGEVNRSSDEPEVSTLNAVEELQILTHYARQLIFWSTSLFHFPYAVTATATAYFKRFYLSNSPMTYHPKSIFPTCLFAATKSENHYIELGAFVDTVKNSKSRITPTKEDVLAAEYLLAQGLRFTLDVKHPRRGLDAVWMELESIAKGDEVVVHSSVKKSPHELKTEMGKLPPPVDTEKLNLSNAAARAGTVHAKAKEVLLGPALLTDVYFLFTPPQTMQAAFSLVDEPLANFYLSLKLGHDNEAQTSRIRKAIGDCAAMMRDFVPGKDPALPKSKQDLVQVDKKLWKCLNPDKSDLVKINAALKAGEGDKSKRKENGVSDGDVTDSAKKKRKVEDDDVFGPPLKKHESPLKRERKDEG